MNTQTEQAIKQDKAWRQSLDATLQEIKSAPKSRERALTITKIQEGIMWLGMDMKSLNEAEPGCAPNPYLTSYDPSSAKVEPTADNLKL